MGRVGGGMPEPKAAATSLGDATQRHQVHRQHLTDFVVAYNFARWLKTPRGLAPYCKRRSKIDPGVV